MEDKLSTMQKALAINLDDRKYGTLVEIGAGQEVSRFFFQAGGAAGTIAKTMSAYDMTVSDSIYGEEPSGRYVCRSRVEKMLDREFPLLVDRVVDVRAKTTQYFAFANTVAAKGYKSKKDCHGWLGVKLQLYPHAEPSKIILHVRMLDNSNQQQQEALGILGINLIYGGFYKFNEPEVLVKELMDDLKHRMEIDYAHFSGPYFEDIDNREIALTMVKNHIAPVALLTPEGEVALPSEDLYKKNILVARGTFKPVTLVNVDMEKKSKEEFKKEKGVNDSNCVYLAEMTMADYMNEGEIDTSDFIHRAELLNDLGYAVLITNYLRFFSLRAYLNKISKKNLGIVLSVPNIIDIFNEQFYEGMEGGILEAFGKLFAAGTRLYVYPRVDIKTGEMVTTDTLKVPEHLKFLYLYLLENRFIVPLGAPDPEIMGIHSENVFKEIQYGDGDWKNQVPESTYEAIVKKKLFGYGSM